MYESPIKLYMTDIQTQIIKQQEKQILKAVQGVAVGVDHEELFRALQYDREQYSKGYADGTNDAMASIVRCKDCTEWDEKEQECSHWYGFRADDFCSYGERKDNS